MRIEDMENNGRENETNNENNTNRWNNDNENVNGEYNEE